MLWLCYNVTLQRPAHAGNANTNQNVNENCSRGASVGGGENECSTQNFNENDSHLDVQDEGMNENDNASHLHGGCRGVWGDSLYVHCN